MIRLLAGLMLLACLAAPAFAGLDAAGIEADNLDALLEEADALAGLGVTLLTVGTGGPDYDLTHAEALCRWRDRRQSNGS